jgi:hypothetical protein
MMYRIRIHVEARSYFSIKNESILSVRGTQRQSSGAGSFFIGQKGRKGLNISTQVRDLPFALRGFFFASTLRALLECWFSDSTRYPSSVRNWASRWQGEAFSDSKAETDASSITIFDSSTGSNICAFEDECCGTTTSIADCCGSITRGTTSQDIGQRNDNAGA